MTRFGDFCHFGKILTVFGSSIRAKAFGQILNLFRQILNANGQIFNIIIGQILKNNLAIWLHCLNIINFASGAFLATDAQS